MQCAVHGLATAPDGRCVVCRREERARQTRGHRSLGAVLVAGAAMLCVLAIAPRLIRRDAAVSVVQPARVAEELVASADTVQTIVPGTDTAQPMHASPSRESVLSLTQAGSLGAAVPQPSGPAPPKTSPPAAPSAAPPSGEQIQAALRGVPIVMFSTSWCPTCARARSFLQANGIPYAERDIDHDNAALQELKHRSGDTLIPTFDIDGKMLRSGFDPSAIASTLAASVERRLGVSGIRVRFAER